MKSIRTAAAILIATFATGGAFAQTSPGSPGSPGAAAQSPAASASASTGVTLTEGEVRKVDKEQVKITLRHGPIANLDMGAMTMVFRVKDPAVLDRLKAGDKVRFAAERADGAIVVTQIEAGK